VLKTQRWAILSAPNSTRQMALKVKSARQCSTSTVASGRLSKWLVFSGARLRTSGGLKKDDLAKNKRGKIVSRRRLARGSQIFWQIKQWMECVVKCRANLNITGFVAVGGKANLGKRLYNQTKELYKLLPPPKPELDPNQTTLTSFFQKPGNVAAGKAFQEAMDQASESEKAEEEEKADEDKDQPDEAEDDEDGIDVE